MKLKPATPYIVLLAALITSIACAEGALPEAKPNRPLSVAMQRVYDYYPAVSTGTNKLYSNFRYTRLQGFDYHGGDGTVSRRDPSRIIRVDGKYYVWYTKRDTATPPQGAARGTDAIPSTDWDLGEVWYATSSDGFTWQEQGVAIPRPPKPALGWRAVCTPEILVWENRYYLFYQAYNEMSGTHGDFCPVTASISDTPMGPWQPAGRVIVPNGAPGEWDANIIHDPDPLVYKGKVYLYYKSEFTGLPEKSRMQGLAIADDPFGPYVKCPLNPVTNSGHETAYFRFKGGIAALITRHGLEHNTIQFAPDGINFRVATTTQFMPFSPGLYDPDAFTDTSDGRGITWGLCHFIPSPGTSVSKHSFLARFDCDLSQDVYDPEMKTTDIRPDPDVYFAQSLSTKQRKRIEAANQFQEK